MLFGAIDHMDDRATNRKNDWYRPAHVSLVEVRYGYRSPLSQRNATRQFSALRSLPNAEPELNFGSAGSGSSDQVPNE